MTTTENLESFGDISRRRRIRSGHPRTEVKANKDTPDELKRVSEEISALGLPHKAVYVKKTSPPLFWKITQGKEEADRLWKKRKANIRRQVLSEALDDSLRGKKGEIVVIVDDHSSYRNIPALCASKSKPGLRTVSGDKYDSAHGRYRDALQTQDYVANAAYSDTKGHHERRRMLRMRMKKLRK